ncbi:MAG: phosphatidate cytidylyltransferase [Candidatus Omnitrophota bacterium]
MWVRIWWEAGSAGPSLFPGSVQKKTKEGTIGGILMSLVVAVVAGRFLTGFSLLHLFALGIILATLGQVGDLAESLIKRDCNVKDSGSYLAGIGGVLDLIDSLLFTAPVFYFYVKTF